MKTIVLTSDGQLIDFDLLPDFIQTELLSNKLFVNK